MANNEDSVGDTRQSSSGGERWIHFTADWEADDEWAPSEFRCERCSTVLESTDACYDHRNGLVVSECFIRRVGRWLS